MIAAIVILYIWFAILSWLAWENREDVAALQQQLDSLEQEYMEHLAENHGVKWVVSDDLDGEED